MNEVAQQELLTAFRELAEVLAGSPSQQRAVQSAFADAGMVSIGHRWSAAFPNAVKPPEEVLPTVGYIELGKSRAFIHPLTQFAACGDYLPEATVRGRIEGAVLSGIAAADGVMRAIRL